MTHVQLFAAVERFLRDVMAVGHEPRDAVAAWGGEVVVAGGDFRQQLPVVRRADRALLVRSCVQASPLWQNFVQLRLRQNMRTNVDEVGFASWLLELGDGRIPNAHGDIPGFINIPQRYVLRKTDNIASVVDAVYPSMITRRIPRNIQTAPFCVH